MLSDGREWRRQLDWLPDEFTLVAWDAPGCGESSDPPETFRRPEYAELDYRSDRHILPWASSARPEDHVGHGEDENDEVDSGDEEPAMRA